VLTLDTQVNNQIEMGQLLSTHCIKVCYSFRRVFLVQRWIS